MGKESYAKKIGMRVFNQINNEMENKFVVLGDGRYSKMEEIISRVVEETISIEREGKPTKKIRNI